MAMSAGLEDADSARKGWSTQMSATTAPSGMAKGEAADDRGAVAIARVASGSVANLLGAAVAAACVFGLTIILTRGLAQDQAGVFFAATSVFLLLSTLSQLGTGTGLVYFVSRSRALGRRTDISAYLRTAIRPVLWVSLVASLALFVLSPTVARLVTPDQVDTTTTYLRALSLFVPFAALENVLLAATRGMGTMRANVLVEQVGRPLLQLVLVGAVVLLGLPGVSVAWAFGYLPAMVVAWLWCRRRVTGAGNRPEPGASPKRREIAGAFWRFTLPRTATSIIQVLMQRFDIVLVAALAGVREAAIYAAATRFVVAGQIGTGAISSAAQPQLGRLIALGDRAATNAIYQTATGWLMMVTWPIFLIFLCFQQTLLGVFGEGYSAGSSVMILMSLAMLVATGFGMVDMVLAMAGRTTWNLMNALVAVTVTIGLDLWLIPTHGVLGAAVGWAAGIVCQNTLALSQVGLSLRLHPFGRMTATVAGLAVSCFLLLPLLVRSLMGQSVPALLVASLSATLIYLPALWMLRRRLHLDQLPFTRLVRRPRGQLRSGDAGQQQ